MIRRDIPLPVDDIASRYEAGETLQELGDAYGVNLWTIRARLTSQGVEIRPIGRRSRLADSSLLDEAVRLYLGGAAMKVLCAKYTTNHRTLKARLLSRGVEIRRGGAA